MNAHSQVSSELSAGLALDLASEIWPEADVFARHNVDPLYGAALLNQDWFKRMVDAARQEWNAITNAKQRIRLKAELAVEHAIEELYKMVVDPNVPAQARVSAFKELKDVSGTAAADQESSGPAAPTVNIFLNGEAQPAISISSKPGRRAAIDVTPNYEDGDEEDGFVVTPGYQDDIEGLAPLA